MAQLIGEIFREAFDNDLLAQGNDQAVFDVPAGRMAMTTDGYVVSPLVFPWRRHRLAQPCTARSTTSPWPARGRCIFPPASSSRRVFRSPISQRIAQSMGEAARDAGVKIVTGDTKVVERGKADGVFISTAGVGDRAGRAESVRRRARPGDAILVSGTIGDHGVAIMSSRENLQFETQILSDSAALHGLVAEWSRPAGRSPAADARSDARRPRGDAERDRASVGRRHPHRRGRDADQASKSRRPASFWASTRSIVANEGKLVAFVAPEAAEKLLAVMRAHPLGRDAAIIGHVVEDEHRFVQMTTSFGGDRIVDWLSGEQLPRIC